MSPLRSRLAALALVVLLALPAIPVHAQASTGSGAPTASGTARLVNFTLVKFNDTLFTAIDEAYRIAFDSDHTIWYTTPGGLVHANVDNATRRIYTHVDGLPESVTVGLAIHGGKVYVATDLGLAVLDKATDVMTPITTLNSPLPTGTVTDLAFVGESLWMGTRGAGVGIWDTTKNYTDASAWRTINTSIANDYPVTINRINAFNDAVYISTEGNGLWRVNPDGTGANLTRADPQGPLISYSVRAVTRMNGLLYIGTDRGIQVRNESAIGTAGEWGHVFNISNGDFRASHNPPLAPGFNPETNINDLDVIMTVNNTPNLFAATRASVWQYDPQTGLNQTLTQSSGVLGTIIYDDVYDAASGWAFASPRGVTVWRNDGQFYLASGPTNPPTNAPLNFGFSSASIGDMSGDLWFGTTNGAAVLHPAQVGHAGYWTNLGPFQDYTKRCGSTINQIDVVGNITWIASNGAKDGSVLCAFDRAHNGWIQYPFPGTSYIYGVQQVGQELWVPLFGAGLHNLNLTTNVGITFSKETLTLPNDYITDVQVQGSNVWLGSQIGVIQFDATTKHAVTTFDSTSGLPGNGVVFRVLPTGASVWVGTQDGGVAKLNLLTHKTDGVWNATLKPGFPGGQVRALYHEGGHIWVGTQEGLARIDIATGEFRAWNGTNGLVQSIVNGIVAQDGILYIATLAGLSRMDIATGAFFPMVDAPGVVRTSTLSTHGVGTGAPSVRVDFPSDGSPVSGTVQISGTATAVGAPITRVEVQIGEGAWQAATGADSWTYSWDSTTAPPNREIAVRVRAFAGAAVSAPTELLLTPIPPPNTVLAVEAFAPARVIAGRALTISARAQGDEPLSAALLYKANGSDAFHTIPMSRDGGAFTATIAGSELTVGNLSFFVQARSGLSAATSPTDGHPITVPVEPALNLAVAISAPANLTAGAGQTLAVPITVTNTGTRAATFALSTAGVRKWVTLPVDSLALGPGESRVVNASLAVPPNAFTDNVTFTFEARDVANGTEPATASVPVHVAGAAPTTTSAPTSGPSRTPLPGALALLALAAVAVALARRRRR